MYKITLYDECCNPICDGVIFFFVESLEAFEENWLPLQAAIDVELINRYFRSKFGEVVIDYYSDDPKLNIVQKVDFESLGSLEYSLSDVTVVLRNAYGCTAEFNFDTLKIKLMKARIGGQYLLLGQYKGVGGKRIRDYYNRWYDTHIKYSQMNFYGNPIANYTYRTVDWSNIGKEDAYKDFYTNDKSFYKDEVVETFVWLPIHDISSDYELKQLDSSELSILMRDIIGEAG